MNKTLYLECASGISGDMTVAALLDLGADEKVLKEVLESLPVKDFRTEISRVEKAGIQCVDFNVILEEDNHDHDMEYLHGDHCEDHHRDHHHGEDHDHHEHHHHHGRHLSDVYAIIDAGKMTDNARELAKKIFRILAESESKAHGVPVEEVHFHEVGAVDSIVDILSIAVLTDNLGITDTVIKTVSEGVGTVRAQHGILPVPVPAVANIAEKYEIPFRIMNRSGEFVTPTGIAALAALWNGKTLPERFTIVKTGYGAGKRKYDGPGYLRAMIIQDQTRQKKDTIWKLETNVDDCTGEALGYVTEKLFEAGARDAHVTPVYMKKNRPGWLLTVITDEAKRKEMERIIFRETTTIGIRRTEMERTVLNRRFEEIETVYGKAVVKVCETEEETRYYPEYESVKALCEKTGASYEEVFRTVSAKAYQK